MVHFESPPTIAPRRIPADVQRLLSAGNVSSDALRLWDAAVTSCGMSIAPILSLIMESSAESDALGSTLICALGTALRADGNTVGRSVQLLSAVLCYAARRLQAGAALPSSVVPALQPALLTSLTRLFGEDAKEVITGCPELALAAMLEAHVASSKKQQAHANLSDELMIALAGVLLRRCDDAGRHLGHAGLVRALGTSAVPHKPTSIAVATELRAGGSRAHSSVCFLAACASRGLCCGQPGSTLLTLNFFHALAGHAPLAVASGFDVRHGLVAASVKAVEAMPAAAARMSANKLLLEVVASLGTVLPATVLAPSSLRHVAGILLRRAADADADIPSRSHAASQLAALLDESSPWAVPAHGEPQASSLIAVQASEAAQDDDDEGEQESAFALASTGERDYVRCTRLLVDSLSESVETSRPLTSKLLATLALLLRRNPWRETPLDLSRKGTCVQASFARLVGIDNFEAVLDALEATAEAATPSPLLDVLGAATLNPCSLGALVQRLVRSASDRTAAAASATMPAHATGQSHFGTALLRRQLLGPERLLNGHTAATIARRLAEVGATASGASEYDALLTSVLLRPNDASYLLPALVALLDDGRSTQDEARETYETASPTACAALGLLARGARLAPAIAVELLPSRRLLELIDAILAWRPASDGGSDGREAISPLLHLLRITLVHGKSGRTAFLALISRAPALALAGAAEALMDLLFIYPLPLVCAALAALLDDLRASSAYNWGVTSTLMHTIGAAAPRLARALHAELKRARPGLSARSQPAVAAAGATGGEEYDYLLEMEEKLAEEEALSHALIAQLAEAAVFRCAPLVVACAEDAATPSSVRMTAVGALGRLMHAHEQMAERLLPSLLTLASPPPVMASVTASADGVNSEQGSMAVPVRRASLLVLASLHPAVPALTEPHTARVLHAALAPHEPLELRLSAIGCLHDLLAARKLQPSAELPHVLPCMLDACAALRTKATACVQQLSMAEGSLRWPHLLRSALLQACSKLCTSSLTQLVTTLVPSTLHAARKEDTEALGVALVMHLREAADLRSSGDARIEGRRRANVATLIGAWPPSDKAVMALLAGLGAAATKSGTSGGDGGGDGGGVLPPAGHGALFTTVCSELAVRRGLQAFAKAARHKCCGRVLEALTSVLRTAHARAEDHGGGISGDDAEGSDGDGQGHELSRRPPTADGRPTKKRGGLHGRLGAEHAVPEARALERRACRDITGLKEARALYPAIEWPALGSAHGSGKSSAGGANKRR